MERPQEREADKVNEPAGETPPDEGLAYDPTMTDADEANIPPESESDPQGEPEPPQPGG